MTNTLKPKTCKYCKQKFIPERPKAICCSPDCAYDYGLKVKSRQEANVIASRRTFKLKGIAEYRKEAQTAFNSFVRERDKDEPCISCGTYEASQWHAGHYLSTGAHPELRFNEDNCFKQCARCNTHLHGNLIEYRKSLHYIDEELLEWLEGPHEPKKYTIDDLKAIKAEYKLKLKELKNGRG